jgi:hypothetical protein
LTQSLQVRTARGPCHTCLHHYRPSISVSLFFYSPALAGFCISKIDPGPINIVPAFLIDKVGPVFEPRLVVNVVRHDLSVKMRTALKATVERIDELAWRFGRSDRRWSSRKHVKLTNFGAKAERSWCGRWSLYMLSVRVLQGYVNLLCTSGRAMALLLTSSDCDRKFCHHTMLHDANQTKRPE